MRLLIYCAVQEGLFLYTHNVSPYDGGVFYQVRHHGCNPKNGIDVMHQAPLLLSFFSLLPPSLFDLLSALVFSLLDLGCAYILGRIADSQVSGNERRFQSPRRARRWDGGTDRVSFFERR